MNDAKSELVVNESEKDAIRNQYQKSLDRQNTEKKQLEFQVILPMEMNALSLWTIPKILEQYTVSKVLEQTLPVSSIELSRTLEKFSGILSHLTFSEIKVYTF